MTKNGKYGVLTKYTKHGVVKAFSIRTVKKIPKSAITKKEYAKKTGGLKNFPKQ